MAYTELVYQEIVRTGLSPSYTGALATGHGFENSDESVILHVKNASGASVDVTISTPNTLDSLAISDLVVAVPAGEERFIGPFPAEVYEQYDSDIDKRNLVLVDTSAQTSVTYAALKIGTLDYE